MALVITEQNHQLGLRALGKQFTRGPSHLCRGDPNRREGEPGAAPAEGRAHAEGTEVVSRPSEQLSSHQGLCLHTPPVGQQGGQLSSGQRAGGGHSHPHGSLPPSWPQCQEGRQIQLPCRQAGAPGGQACLPESRCHRCPSCMIWDSSLITWVCCYFLELPSPSAMKWVA